MEAVRGYWSGLSFRWLCHRENPSAMRAAAFETGLKTNAELKILGLFCFKLLEGQSD